MKRSTLYSIGLVALLVTWSLAPWSPVLWTLATNHKAPSVQQSYKGLPQITPLESVTGDDAGDGQVATWNGQHWKGKTPGGSTAVTPPPAGYVEWLTADQGVTFGTSGGWTNTLLATWDASSTDFWSGGSVTCSSGLINRRPAVAGLVQGQCSYNSTILWTNMTAGGACWTLAAVYQYTGTATGQAGSPTLDLAHGGGLIFDGLGWAGITVGNSGPMYGYQATAAACQAYPGVGTCVQATSDAGTAPNPHYVVGNFCNNTLSVWLDGIAGPSISDDGGLVTVQRPQIGINGSGFVGLWRTFVVYRSTPDIPTLNTWLKNYGGF